jgi:hypothetical protein
MDAYPGDVEAQNGGVEANIGALEGRKASSRRFASLL